LQYPLPRRDLDDRSAGAGPSLLCFGHHRAAGASAMRQPSGKPLRKVGKLSGFLGLCGPEPGPFYCRAQNRLDRNDRLRTL